MTKRVVRRPRVDLDARGAIANHGPMRPSRGIWHTTECGDIPDSIRELEGVVNFWREQNLGYGAHVIIDKDGNSALCADPNKVTWHTAGRNTGSYGIELIGFARFTPAIWWTRKDQLDKTAKWMAWLNYEYDVPLRFGVNYGWSGHRDQPEQTHTDPGLWFPKNYVLRKANKYRAEGWM